MVRWWDDMRLEGSSVVANNAMNRDRGLRGVNDYVGELGFDPLVWPRSGVGRSGEPGRPGVGRPDPVRRGRSGRFLRRLSTVGLPGPFALRDSTSTPAATRSLSTADAGLTRPAAHLAPWSAESAGEVDEGLEAGAATHRRWTNSWSALYVDTSPVRRCPSGFRQRGCGAPDPGNASTTTGGTPRGSISLQPPSARVPLVLRPVGD